MITPSPIEESPVTNQKSPQQKYPEQSPNVSKSKNTSGTSHKSTNSKNENQPGSQQILKESTNHYYEPKITHQNQQIKGPSDSLQLYEWSGFQDSRCLKEDDHLGVFNNQEISVILPNMLKSSTFYFHYKIA